jgi:hypothetical protein
MDDGGTRALTDEQRALIAQHCAAADIGDVRQFLAGFAVTYDVNAEDETTLRTEAANKLRDGVEQGAISLTDACTWFAMFGTEAA